MSPPASLPASLLRKLASVRRRRRALAWIQAACWTLLGVSLLALLLATHPVVPGPAWLRIGARLWLAATVFVPLAVLVVPVWRRTASWASLARAVDDRVPETADHLLTAVDLASALDAHSISEPETERLARVHLGEADRLSAAVRPEQLLPLRGLPRSTLLGPGAALAVAALWFLAPARLQAGLDGAFGALPATEVAEEDAAEDELVTLVLKNLSLRLVPPAYAQRSEIVLDGTTGDIVALPGTRVFLDAVIPSSGKAVAIELDQAPDVIEGAVSGDAIEAEFVTTGSTWYRVVVERGLGRGPLQSRKFRIDVLPDRPPELEVSAPAGPITLSPTDSVPLNVRASDDFALSRLEQVVLLDGAELLRQPIAEVAGTSSFDDVLRWSPESLGGQGGELEFVVEAWDNDTVNGPKVTRSRPLEIYVPTPRDQHRKVLELKRTLQDAALDMLAGLLVADTATGGSTGRVSRTAMLEEHDGIARLADGFFRVAAELVEAMARDTLGTMDTYAGVLGLVENLDTRWSTVVEFVENGIRADERSAWVHPVIARDLAALHEPAISELEQIVLDLGAYIDMHRGDEVRGDLAALGNELAEMQELLRRANDGEPMDAALAEAMKKLEERMAEVARKLAERSSGPDDGFVNSVPGEMSKSSLAEVQELIRQGRFEEAMEKLRQADEALAQLEESIASESQQMSGSQDRAEMDKALSEAIQDAKRLEAQQEAILKETDELAERFASPQAAEEMEKLQQDVAALKEQVEELRQGGGDDPFAPTGAERSRVRSAAFEIAGMEAAIADGLPDEAAAYAREAQSHLRDAARSAESGDRAGKERSAGKLAGSIADRLEAMQAEQSRSQAQARRAGQQTGERQGGVANGVAELAQRMGEGAGSAFNPAQGRQNLENAEQLMRGAQGKLAQGDPTRAGSSGRDGLSQLRQFRESLESAQQAMRQTGPPRPGGGMAGRPGGPQPGGEQNDSESRQAYDSGSVEITDPDEFVGPEAFRALLQEGAQGDAPDRYKPLNGTYYEELVR
jgi:tetratricopeptide (TPR) repeat protein